MRRGPLQEQALGGYHQKLGHLGVDKTYELDLLLARNIQICKSIYYKLCNLSSKEREK